MTSLTTIILLYGQTSDKKMRVASAHIYLDAERALSYAQFYADAGFPVTVLNPDGTRTHHNGGVAA